MRRLNGKFALSIALVFIGSNLVCAERWSKQLTPETPVSISDWVPIAKDRSGKSLTFGDDLVPAAQQQFQFFAEPQNNRFNLQQTHPAHHSHQTHSGTPDISSYSIQNASPQFQFVNSPKQRTVQTFGGPVNSAIAEPLIQNPPPFQYMQEVQRGPHVHHYQSQPIPKPLQGFTQNHQHVPTFQHLPSAGQSRNQHFQNIAGPPKYQNIPPQFQQIPQQQSTDQEDQSVQLLYVPYDNLYQQNQQPPQQSFINDKQNRFNILNQPVSASLINDLYSQNEVQEIPTKSAITKKPFTTKRPTIAPTQSSLRPTTPFDSSTKLKAHQPPLSMFVAIDRVKGQATESDVLSTLRISNSIDVMDTITNDSPKVFIGPSGMPPPEGYSKFDLPYLSNIEGTRNERKIEQLPFFVAPLSYRTPPGFSKIPLPAPHVGSVVVNQPNTIENNESSGFTQDSYYTKQPSTVRVNSPSSNVEPKKTQTVQLTSGFHFSPNGVQLHHNEFTFPTIPPSSQQTTIKPFFSQTKSPSTAYTPLTKVKASDIEKQRNEFVSTYNPSTTRTPVTRSKYVEFEQTKLERFPTSRTTTTTQAPVTQTKFTELDEHKTVNEEYFGVSKTKKPTFAFSFGSNAEKPAKDFNFKPIPEFNFGAFNQEPEYVATKRPKIKLPTTATPTLETQKSRSEFSFPSSTSSPSFDFSPTVSVIENTDTYRQTHGGNFFNDFRSTVEPAHYTINNQEQIYTQYQDTSFTPQQYHQESTRDNVNQEEQQVFIEDAITTENPNFSLPSELPAISADLPVRINDLMDEQTIIPDEITTTTTRKPVSRRVRPTATTYRTRTTTTTEDYERKPINRRRPSTYNTRASISTESSIPSRSTASRVSKVKYNATSEDRKNFRTRGRSPTTIKQTKEEEIEYQRDVLNQNYPSSVRPNSSPSTQNPIEEIHIRNEQQREEIPLRHNINGYNAPIEHVEVIPLGGNENENTENYYTPSHETSFYENTIETSSTTQSPPLPSNHRNTNHFVGLQEPMQVPQHHRTVAHRLNGNFHRNTESFYKTKTTQETSPKPTEIEEEELLLSEPVTQPSSSTTTLAPETTESDAPVTRRINFSRRRLPYTTTESAPSESTEATEAYGTRSRGRKENVVVVKKVRGRTRLTTTTTEEPSTESTNTRRSAALRTRTSYNRNTSREPVNRERASANKENNNEENKPRFRIRENTQRFRLDTQESQWSTRFNQNSFLPIDEEKSKSLKTPETDDEQEIITANPDAENDSYLINVSASVLPTQAAIKQEIFDESSNVISTTEKDIFDAKRNKDIDFDMSIEKLVKDVIDDIDNESKSESKNEKKPIGTEKKTNGRRGVWKKIRVRPADAFETAETQNIGKHLYNALTDNDKGEGIKIRNEQTSETTTETTENSIITEPTIESEIILSTEAPLEHVFSEIITTQEPNLQNENEKSGMFDEARKALNVLFSLEGNSDDAVNMEETDDNLETFKESTTTTQIPITEEQTTTAAPTQVPIESLPNAKQVKTSTSSKVTGEICYRGRCIKTQEK